MTKVWVLPGDSRTAAIEMFQNRGFEPGSWPETADLICFLGGTDVDPKVYGAVREHMTQPPDIQRDRFELTVFNKFPNVPKVGICRGGQLLNVLNGGKMIQHLGQTVSGVVSIRCYQNDSPTTNKEVLVDHHQGMGEGSDFEFPFAMSVNTIGYHHPAYVVTYPKTKSLCYQGHPEWGDTQTEKYFFELLNEVFEMKSLDL